MMSAGMISRRQTRHSFVSEKKRGTNEYLSPGTFGRDVPPEPSAGTVKKTEDRKREAGPLAGDRTQASPLNSRDFFLILEERILPS